MRIRAKLAATTFGTLAGLLVAFTTHAQNRLLVSWDPVNPAVQLVMSEFVPRIKEKLGKNFISAISGPETVAPFEQFEPARAGVFQLLLTHPAYHFGTTRLPLFVEAIDGPPEARRQSGVWHAIDEHYRGFGMKLIFMLPQPDGFQLMLREPVGEPGDLAGRRIRATPTYRALIDYLGAASVTMPIGDVYTSLERGVVDGAAGPLLGSSALRWHEGAPYLLRPRFGETTYFMLMNLTAWNNLEPDQQETLLQVARDVEDLSYPFFAELQKEEEALILGEGGKITELSPELAKNLGKVWADGLFEVVKKTDPAKVENLRSLARQANLTP